MVKNKQEITRAGIHIYAIRICIVSLKTRRRRTSVTQLSALFQREPTKSKKKILETK
jgi:hypothetical protein